MSQTDIAISLGPRVRLTYHRLFRHWYMSADGCTFHELPRRVQRVQTAIDHACRYYSLPTPANAKLGKRK